MTAEAARALSNETSAESSDRRAKAGGRVEPRRPFFGIKGKLFLALWTLAALTAVASAVAWSVFVHIDRSVTRVTAESVPGMVASLHLAEKTAEIAATAPAIMASNTQEVRLFEQTKLDQKTQDLAALIEDLAATGVAPGTTVELRRITDRISAQLAELNAAVERRLRLKAEKEAGVAALSSTHAKFLEALEPLVDDSVFDLVISGEQVTAESTSAITGLVEGGVSNLDRLLTISAEGNLAAGLLGEAAHVGKQALLQPIRERFQAAAAAIERNLRQLPEGAEKTGLQQAVEALLDFGTGPDNIFDLRTQVLKAGSADSVYPAVGQEQTTTALKAVHDALLVTLTPMIDDEAFELVLATEEVTAQSTRAITDLIDIGANTLHVLLTVRAEGNLAAGLLNEAAGTSEASLLQPLRERFIAAEGQIERMLAQLPASLDDGALRESTSALVDLGKADDSIFALRREELQQIANAQLSLETSRALAVRLGDEVARLVAVARNKSDVAASRSTETIQQGKLFMMMITTAGVLGAAIVMLYYVGPRIIQPLENITKAMTDLAAGDTSVEIPGRTRGDELGRMAQALGVFRDTAIKVQKSNIKEIRETRRRLSDAIESISEAFSLYDNGDRLVVCNSKYRTLLYPGIADEIVPGMTFEAIIRRAAERGYVRDAKGRVEAWLAERLAQHHEPGEPHVQQRGDGRWILVSERKTEDGGTVAVYSDITELKQREEELADKSNSLEQLSNQLAKYLSPQVYESIFTGQQEVKVASRRKKLTVFFSDIAGFTETADRLESEDLSQLLNHYLTEMSQIALAHGATIDKFVGDAIVIFFGDPETKGIKEDALACIRMAIAMRKRMLELQGVWRDSGIEKPLKCRIGVNTGFCTVGNFGSEDRMDYTIIGGGVNLASRLEGAATPGEILISYETYAQVKDEIHCEERGAIDVKGIAYPVATYQVIDSYDALGKDRQRIREDHPNMKLDLDLDSMSADERGEAAVALRRALDRLSGSGESSKPVQPATANAGTAKGAGKD